MTRLSSTAKAVTEPDFAITESETYHLFLRDAIFDVTDYESRGGKIITLESWQQNRAWIQDVHDRQLLRAKYEARDKERRRIQAEGRRYKESRSIMLKATFACTFCIGVSLLTLWVAAGCPIIGFVG